MTVIGSVFAFWAIIGAIASGVSFADGSRLRWKIFWAFMASGSFAVIFLGIGTNH